MRVNFWVERNIADSVKDIVDKYLNIRFTGHNKLPISYGKRYYFCLAGTKNDFELLNSELFKIYKINIFD